VADDSMNVELLYDDPFMVAAGAQNPWCRRRRVKLADLLNEPWTLPSRDSLTWPLVAEVFRANGLRSPCGVCRHFDTGPQRVAGEWTLPHHASRFSVEACWRERDQGSARRHSGGGQANRDRYPKRPCAQSGSRTLHLVRARSCRLDCWPAARPWPTPDLIGDADSRAAPPSPWLSHALGITHCFHL
jgi:DNA-binding transcriptional LysR family regulator